MPELIPDVQDEVRHKNTGDVGIVIATYALHNIPFIDVRINDHIRYQSIRSYWEVVKKCDE